jgi:methyltransferase (TIGR00027 family)
MRPAGSTWLRPQLLARTRFFDDEVLRAISAGTRQIVICGAGYDDRALRFRTTGVRFFELDHPVTQADKARRLRDAGLVATGRETTESAGPGPTLAPADFRTDDVAGVLAAHGQSAAEPGLFICEGLLVYLDERAIVELLTALARRAGPGSTLAASLSVHRAGADSERVKAVANARRRASRSEPWQTILPREAHLDLLREAGWVPDRAVDAADLAEGTDRDRSLLVTATLT